LFSPAEIDEIVAWAYGYTSSPGSREALEKRVID